MPGVEHGPEMGSFTPFARRIPHPCRLRRSLQKQWHLPNRSHSQAPAGLSKMARRSGPRSAYRVGRAGWCCHPEHAELKRTGAICRQSSRRANAFSTDSNRSGKRAIWTVRRCLSTASPSSMASSRCSPRSRHAVRRCCIRREHRENGHVARTRLCAECIETG
jgi:hypothetical protein